MAGQWVEVPNLCARRWIEQIVTCAQWADQGSAACSRWADEGSNQCTQWADEGSNQCTQWADEGSNQCCDWAPCSWFCDAFYWVAKWVCLGWYWVAKWVCLAWFWVANWVCQAWYWVAKWVCIAWQSIVYVFCFSSFNGGTMLLLTDGTVLLNECSGGYGTERWWKLTPDVHGSYVNGSWTQAASSHFGRKYFASAVLADGTVIVCGGEYSNTSGSNQNDDTNKCELYHPESNSWTDLAPPSFAGWGQIGDSPCCVLPDGRFLLGSFNSTNVVTFDNTTQTWAQAASKADSGSEESWVLMGDGTVVTAQCGAHPGTEKYEIGADKWKSAGAMPAGVDLVEASSIEIGPAILLPDGRGFFVGATGQTALYDPNAKVAWTAGPSFPQVSRATVGTKDGPGCLMPNGKVLCAVGPVDGKKGDYNTPTYFFEFDGSALAQVSSPANAGGAPYVGRMLLLPTGEVLFCTESSDRVFAYVPDGGPHKAWRPRITKSPKVAAPATTIEVTGTQFNGLSQAVGYGDDSAAATNYPIARIVSGTSGAVRYCRTKNHSSMGVATGADAITTQVMIPPDIEWGASLLVIVANGIPSRPVPIIIRPESRGEDDGEG
jgi:Kelch motif